jgi:uncharacterized membrane protein
MASQLGLQIPANPAILENSNLLPGRSPTGAAPDDNSAMAPASSGRILFVDFARAIAVLFMIQGHSLAVLLAPGYEQTVPFGLWLYLRGLTSCTFLFLSGFSFALATERHRPDYLAPTPRLRRRLARLALFLTLGYAMRIPVRPLSQLSQLTVGQWQAFGAVDILQLVAVSLFALQVLAWIFRTPGRLGAAALGGAALIVAATPPVWGVAWTSVLPLFPASYFTAATGSLFPLFPWGAYIFLGAALGSWYVRQPDASRRAGRRFALAGAAMIAAGTAFRLSPLAPYGPTEFWTVSPNLFLVKAGAVLVLLSGAIALTRRRETLPRVFTVLSHESLTIYFIHLCLLYGSIWNDGLFQLVGPRLGLSATFAWVTAMLVGMSTFAWAWSEFKQRWQPVSALVRAGVAVAALYVIV